MLVLLQQVGWVARSAESSTEFDDVDLSQKVCSYSVNEK